jgi:hypothetical protein
MAPRLGAHYKYGAKEIDDFAAAFESLDHKVADYSSSLDEWRLKQNDGG